MVSHAVLPAHRDFVQDPLQHAVLPDRRQDSRAPIYRGELSIQRRIDEVSIIFFLSLTSSEADRTRGSFIQDVYENIENRYTVLHTFLDEKFPEPAWRRKHQPISVNLELRWLAVFAKMRRQSDDVELLMGELERGRSPPAGEKPAQLPFGGRRSIWSLASGPSCGVWRSFRRPNWRSETVCGSLGAAYRSALPPHGPWTRYI